MGGRINTVMQTCFFAISGVLPREAAIEAIKHAIQKSYGKRGDAVVQRNFEAVAQTLDNPRGIVSRLMDGVRVACEGAAGGKECQGAEAGRDRRPERERGHDADPVAQAPHHRDLHRAGEARDETHADGQRVPSRHRPDARRLR